MTGGPTADVVVVGGGAMGSAAAYFLMALGGPALRVIVCEADPTYAHSATLNAAGGIRQTFLLRENIEMSRFGADFLRGASELLMVDNDRPNVGFHPTPYLYLASTAEDLNRLRQCHHRRQALSVQAAWLRGKELRDRFPSLTTEDADVGLLGGADEGVFDPEALLRALRRKAIALGASYRHARVVGIRSDSSVASGVVLDTGEQIRSGCVINAAGPGAASVAALVGRELAISPRTATTFIFQSATPVVEMPIVVDRLQGLHIRREGDRYLASMPHADTSSGKEGDGADFFQDNLWPALAHRVPAFEAIRFAGTWSGTVDASPIDGNPFIGPDPSFPNFYALAGFNGHGLQHAPAAGRAIAELIVEGAYRSIDLSRFGVGRSFDPSLEREHF